MCAQQQRACAVCSRTWQAGLVGPQRHDDAAHLLAQAHQARALQHTHNTTAVWFEKSVAHWARAQQVRCTRRVCCSGQQAEARRRCARAQRHGQRPSVMSSGWSRRRDARQGFRGDQRHGCPPWGGGRAGRRPRRASHPARTPAAATRAPTQCAGCPAYAGGCAGRREQAGRQGGDTMPRRLLLNGATRARSMPVTPARRGTKWHALKAATAANSHGGTRPTSHQTAAAHSELPVQPPHEVLPPPHGDGDGGQAPRRAAAMCCL